MRSSGTPLRIYGCAPAHSYLFCLLGVGFAAAPYLLHLSGWGFRRQPPHEFSLAFLGCLSVPGAMVILLGVLNSRIRLSLSEDVLTYRWAFGGWECRYSEIAEVRCNRQTARGITMLTGLTVVLTDEQTYEAKAIRQPEKAAQEILRRRDSLAGALPRRGSRQLLGVSSRTESYLSLCLRLLGPLYLAWLFAGLCIVIVGVAGLWIAFLGG